MFNVRLTFEHSKHTISQPSNFTLLHPMIQSWWYIFPLHTWSAIPDYTVLSQLYNDSQVYFSGGNFWDCFWIVRWHHGQHIFPFPLHLWSMVSIQRKLIRKVIWDSRFSNPSEIPDVNYFGKELHSPPEQCSTFKK